MQDQRSHYSVALDEKPCTVKYVKEWSSFLVGTYILLPTIEDAKAKFSNLNQDELIREYENINRRAGSLILLAHDEETSKFDIKERLSCAEGGVFELTVLNGIIYVAHANNTIGLYEYNRTENKLSAITNIKLDTAQASTTLLTSIDACCIKISDDRELTLVVVGDSQGFITIIDVSAASSCKIIARNDITRSQDPVWSVKFTPSTAGLVQDSLLLIVACEDCCWYIYDFDFTKESQDEDSLNELFKRKDFTAGVTSICFGPCNNDKQRAVILGSYDESMRLYAIETQSRKRVVAPKFLFESHISGGGIWRMNPVKDELYVAAMYAGSYKASIKQDWSWSQFTKLFEDSLRESNAKTSSSDEDAGEASLHYDIEVSVEHNTICVVDFNKSLCLLAAAAGCED